MKLGIMQPYFFPYLGYWQLMNAVDKYIVYDDVNYIKGGRINRNAILLQGKAHNINLILQGASPNKHINQIKVNTIPNIQRKLLKTIDQAYRKAPYYNQVMPILHTIITQEEDNLAKYLFRSFEIINNYLGIDTELIPSSDLKKNNDLKKEEKIYHICDILKADEYYNSINGKQLYNAEEFNKRGIKLNFLVMKDIRYKQFNNDFVPNLSIIDVIMFNSQEQCRELLSQYELIKG